MTVNDEYIIGIYWPKRKEPVEICAARCRKLLSNLSQFDPLFSHWFTRNRSNGKSQKQPVDIQDEALLRDLLLEGRNYTDTTKTIIEDLGFSIHLWAKESGNEMDDQFAKISIHCGCYSNYVGNNCVIDIPKKGDSATRILQVPILTSIMKCLVATWKPKWGTVISQTYRDIIPRENPHSLWVGWITYFANEYGEIPPLVAPSYTIPVDDIGNMVITMDELLIASSPEHKQILQNLFSILKQSGLLKLIS